MDKGKSSGLSVSDIIQLGTEMRLYNFAMQDITVGVNQLVTNHCQIIGDGEIVAVLVGAWDTAATARVAFHVGFRLEIQNFNIAFARAGLVNPPGAGDFARMEVWQQLVQNSKGFWPGIKVKAGDDLTVTVRTEATYPAAGATVMSSQVLVVCRERAMNRQAAEIPR